MNKPKYNWYVRHSIHGRVVMCELLLNDSIRYLIVGLWPWERRQPATELLKKMAYDADRSMYFIQINAAIKPAQEVTHERSNQKTGR